MFPDDGIDFFPVTGRKIAGNCVFHRTGGVSVSQSLGIVARIRQQTVKDAGNVSVAGTDPVDHLDIVIRFLLVEGIFGGAVNH